MIELKNTNSGKMSQFLTTSTAGAFLALSARIGYLKLLPLKCSTKACTRTFCTPYKWANL